MIVVGHRTEKRSYEFLKLAENLRNSMYHFLNHRASTISKRNQQLTKAVPIKMNEKYIFFARKSLLTGWELLLQTSNYEHVKTERTSKPLYEVQK